MTTSERNDAALDPFCGFNVGSTVYRATPEKKARADKFVFESPLLRLVTDFQYRQVYQDGSDISDPDWAPPPDAQGLSDLILKVQSLVCAWSDSKTKAIEPNQFRCYLVAHTMALRSRGSMCRHGLPFPNKTRSTGSGCRNSWT